MNPYAAFSPHKLVYEIASLNGREGNEALWAENHGSFLRDAHRVSWEKGGGTWGIGGNLPRNRAFLPRNRGKPRRNLAGKAAKTVGTACCIPISSLLQGVLGNN